MKYIQKTNVAYAKHDKKEGARQLVGLRLSTRTLKGVEELKALFATRYPADRTPTVSAVMNGLIQARLEYFEANPEELEAELREFRQKYSTATQPSTTEKE